MQVFNANSVFKRIFSSRELLLISAFWILVGSLSFLQDYLYSVWRGSTFGILESLSFKIFWLLFIPFTIAFYAVFARTITVREGRGHLIFYLLLPSVFSILHLLVFALCLSGLSHLMHSRPWEFMWLIQMKLSTHLVYAISIYIVMTYLSYRNQVRKKHQAKPGFRKTLSVKNGVRTTVLPVDSILWIGAKGDYLEVHTADRKHVIISSLKDVLSELDPEQFKRIHKSTILNVKVVSEIRSRLTGDYDIITSNGKTLRLSRNYAGAFKGTLL